MKVLPIRIFAAADHTRKTVLQRIYARHNFPSEAATLTISLHTAIELLLRYEIDDTKRHVAELVDAWEDWDCDQKKLAHWVRKRRNEVLHRGEFLGPEQEIALKTLDSAIQLLGSLWIERKGSLIGIFNDYEISILLGREPNWDHESEFIARAALMYYRVDPRAAITMANLAFEIAARGFGFAWGVANCKEMDITDLISEMDLLEDEMAHLSLYDEFLDPGVNFKEFGGEHAPWFYPPMTQNEILGSPNEWSLTRAAIYYCQEILDAVVSYPNRIPYIEFFRCLTRNWPDIFSRLTSQFPTLSIPQIDIERMKDWHYFPGSSLYFPGPHGVFDMFKPSDVLDMTQLKSFISIVEEICGPIPSPLQL